MHEEIKRISKEELELQDYIIACIVENIHNRIIYHQDEMPNDLYKILHSKLSELMGILYYRMQPHAFDDIFNTGES